MNRHAPAPLAQPKTRPAKASPALRTIDSQALFGAVSQVLITHRGETYKLQITRQGKLILTK